MMPKILKKPSSHALAQQVKALQAVVLERNLRSIADNQEIARLKAALAARVDTSMLAERARLASSLGHLTEAVARAIQVVVGKEVM